MKQGKVFAKLANNSKVEKINFNETGATVVLKDEYHNNGKNFMQVKSAHEANLFIRGAEKQPTAKPGFKIVRNLLTGLPVEIAENTPIYCDPSSETYHSM